MREWIAATVLLALGAAFSSGWTPFIAAVGGAFRPSDFASNVAAAREIAAGRDPYQGDFGPLHAAVLGIPPSEGRPYFPHPPLAALLVRPLAPLSFASAALVWFALSLGLLFAIALFLAEVVSGSTVGRNGGPPGGLVAALYLALLAWPPVLYNLEKGQWSILLSLIVVLCWRSLSRGHVGEAGALVGLATALKAFPALLAPYLLLRGARTTVLFALTLAAGLLIPLAWMGPGAFEGFLRHSQANLPYWETWLAVTYSLDGVIARTLIGGPWARPIVHAPVAARIVVAVLSVVLLTVALWAAGRRAVADEREGARFAAFATLLVLLNPLAMGHNGVLLALPIALVGRALVNSPPTWLRACWATGVVLASIPKETVFRLCPVPVDPVRAIGIVALPFWGALLLFTAAVAVAVRQPSTAQLRGRGLAQ